jgi:hypothetical protein
VHQRARGDPVGHEADGHAPPHQPSAEPGEQAKRQPDAQRLRRVEGVVCDAQREAGGRKRHEHRDRDGVRRSDEQRAEGRCEGRREGPCELLTVAESHGRRAETRAARDLEVSAPRGVRG